MARDMASAATQERLLKIAAGYDTLAERAEWNNRGRAFRRATSEKP